MSEMDNGMSSSEITTTHTVLTVTKNMIRRKPSTIGYLLIVVAMVWGLWRVEQTADDAHKLAEQVEEQARIIEDEAARRVIRQCEFGNERRRELRSTLTEDLPEAFAAAGASPEGVQRFTDALTPNLMEALPEQDCGGET